MIHLRQQAVGKCRTPAGHARAISYLVLIGLTTAAAAFIAPSARADLFVTQYRKGGSSIGQYTGSGDMVNDPLITGFHTPMGVASSGSQLFITDLSVGCISACTTSGQVVNSGLVTGLTDPRGIAVDSTGHNLFVTLPGYVGKYDTVTGQGTDRLITLQNFPLCVAVVGTNLFVTTTDGTGGTIEKYDTDGNYLTTLVSGLNQPYGVTLDAAGQFLYTGTVDGSVWEYSATTGNLIKQLVNGSPQTPYGLAVDGSDLYVVTGAMGQPSHVGKYNLATDEWNPYLTTSDSGMIGIALATVPEPGTAGLVLLGLGWLGYRRIRTA